MKSIPAFSLATVLILVFATPATSQIVETPHLRIDLFASFEIEYQLEDEGLGDPNGSFDADQMDLVFNYQKEQFRIAIDIAVEHGVSTEDDRGNVVLSFGFAEYSHSRALKLRAGKYLTPFGLYNEYNSLKTAFLPVKLPLATNKPGSLTSAGFRFFPRRQVGLAVLGSLASKTGSFDYDVVLSNGDQEEGNPFEEDDNSQKALTLRGVYHPSTGPNLGLSAYLDTLQTPEGSARLSSFGLSAAHSADRALLQAEVQIGDLDAPVDGDGVTQWAGYLEIGFPIGNLTPYFEAQYLETESDVQETAEVFIAGINYRFKKYAVVKLEGAYTKGNAANREFEGIPGRDYNEIRAAIVMGF